MHQRFAVGPVRISAVGFEESISTVLEARDQGRRLAIHFCTAHTIVEASESEDLRAALERADLLAPDGMPLVWLGRLRRLAVERVCGPDFMGALLDRGRSVGYRHYLYGGPPGMGERLAELARRRFPGVQIVGVASPPFRNLSPEEDAAAVAAINAASPDCVWIGLGSPKQDLWLAEHRSLLAAAAVLAVGAAFDFNAGTKRRAPRWMQRTGTEWFFRLLSEPTRLWRRYTVINLKFAALLGRSALRRFRWA